jgi:hypothetical protein
MGSLLMPASSSTPHTHTYYMARLTCSHPTRQHP